MTWRSKLGAVIWSVLVATSLLGATAAFAGPVAAQSSQADVVFVFDKTTSMDPIAADLKAEVENVANELDSQGIDTRYALIEYESETNTDVVQLEEGSAFTNDPQKLENALDAFSTECCGTEDASGAIQKALDLNYRSDAQKIIVVITNEDDDSSQETRDAAISNLDDQDACLVAVSPDWYFGDENGEDELKTMAQQAECGEWTDVNSESFTTVVADLVDVIKEEVDPVVPDARPDFEVVQTSVENTTVYTDETFNATVVVENTGNAGGSYHALVTDSGQVLHSEHVDIAPGERETITARASYAETGEYRVQINYRTLEYVTVVDRPLPDDEINVTGGSVARSTVATGESYAVTATVENVGNNDGYATIPLASGDNGTNSTAPVANHTVQLDPGESKTISYEATAPEDAAGEELTWTASGQVLGNVSVESLEEVGVVDAYANTSSVAPGDAYEVTAVVYNPGDESDVFTVTIGNESGTADSFRMVEVGPGESVSATWTKEAPADAGEGTATWWFNGDAAFVDVAIEA